MNSAAKPVLLLVCACLAVCVWLQPAPAHAAIPNPFKSHLLDRASQHFQNNLQKWGAETTKAGLALFWMLATIACCWELGSLGLRGGSMDQALTFLVRFAFILGLWFYILQNAVPIGTAIIDSLRKLGATSSGLPDDLTMPSSILNVGWSILWKTIKFVASTGWHAPIVAFFALGMALAILMAFGLTAINMFLLIVSQWFLLYGGIFFLGFGGAPWGSQEAKNYLYLALSIGAQLLAMIGVVGVGESFIQEQYAALSGDTSLGELCVVFFVGLVVFFLSNDIPKMFARFVPNSYSPPGLGVGTMIGGLGTAVAAGAAAGVMIKSAAANVTGIAKAGRAAHDAAKSQSQSKPSEPARSQTGVGAANGGGTIGAAGGDGASRSGSGERAGTQTQGPLAAMLSRSGIGNAGKSTESTNGSSSRAGTQASSAKTSGPQKSSANEVPSQATEEEQANAQTPAEEGRAGGSEADTATARGSSSEQTETASAAADESSRSTGRSAEDESSARSADAESGTGNAEETDAREPAIGGERWPQKFDDDDPDEESAERQPAAGRASSAASSPADTAASTSADAAGGGETPQSGASSSSSTASSSSSTSGTAPASSAAGVSATGPSAETSASTSQGAGRSAERSASATTPSGTAPGAKIASSTPTAGSADKSSSSGAAASGNQGASATATSSSTAGPQVGESGSNSAASAAPAEAAVQRGSTSITPAASGASTFVEAAKILGAHAVEHQKNRFNEAKDAFMARADKTAGGQIAQAIRKKYGLDNKASDDSNTESTPRAQTGVSAPEPTAPTPEPTPAPPPAQSNASGPKPPSEWATADDPMTDNQRYFLERRLGEDDVDPNMTKAEASVLIKALLDE